MPRPRQVADIPISSIDVAPAINPLNPADIRDGIEQLATSIKKFGLLQPIVVFETNNHRYVLVAGRRRVLALTLLRVPSIQAVILDEAITPEMAGAIWLTENLVRQDLNRAEVAQKFQALFQKFPSDRAVSAETGIPLDKIQPYHR